MIRISELTSSADLESVYELETCIENGWTQKMILDAFNSGSSKFIKAESDSKIVGYIGYGVILDEVEIYSVAVASEFRNRGIGQMLLTELLKTCQANGIKSIFLEVNENNLAAISLYKKCGFNLLNRREKYYGNEAALVLQKNLTL